MRVLVTGSNGFIGKHVCKYLKERNFHVIGLGRREQSETTEVDEYISCDLSDVSMRETLKGLEADAVVHLAADMRQQPYETEVVHHNCVGTQQLLEACIADNVKVFVQLSSLPVIGKPIEHPITEAHPIKPPTVYHVTKYTEELLADFAYRMRGLRTVSFRISAPVGIGMKEKTIFPTFIKNALQGKDLQLYGKGTREQTFIHVNDIAQAIYKAILSEQAVGVYNLSSHNRISNCNLAKLCKEVLHSESRIVYVEVEDEMDCDIWDISLERIEKDMGFKPMVSLEESIIELADYYKKMR